MQTIYLNDKIELLNICNPNEGTNTLQSKLNVESFSINNTAYYILYTDIQDYNCIFFINLKVTKNITDNITHYIIGEYGINTDPTTYIQSNQYSDVDYITMCFVNKNNTNIRLRFSALDDNNNIVGIKSCIGDINVVYFE